MMKRPTRSPRPEAASPKSMGPRAVRRKRLKSLLRPAAIRSDGFSRSQRLKSLLRPTTTLLKIALLGLCVLAITLKAGAAAASPRTQGSTPTPAPTATATAPEPFEVARPADELIRSGDPALIRQSQGAPRQVNIAFILDASGSMNANLPGAGKTKLTVAKEVLVDLLSQVPADVNTALWVYGHRYPQTSKERSCGDIERLFPSESLDASTYTNAIQSIRAVGYTPIAASLKLAAQDIPAGEDQLNTIILISDGKETCGSDPQATARSLKVSEAAITTHVVDYAADAASSAQLQQIAQASDGIYRDAENAGSLAEALSNAMEAASSDAVLRVETSGADGTAVQAPMALHQIGANRHTTGLSTWTDYSVPAGVYDITARTMPPVTYRQVRIPAGSQTVIPAKLGAFDLLGPGNEALRPPVTIFESATGREIDQYAAGTPADLYHMLPGEYDVAVQNAGAFRGVPIEAGQITRLALGALELTTGAGEARVDVTLVEEATGEEIGSLNAEAYDELHPLTPGTFQFLDENGNALGEATIIGGEVTTASLSSSDPGAGEDESVSRRPTSVVGADTSPAPDAAALRQGIQLEGNLPALAVGTTAALSVIFMFIGILRIIEGETSPDQRLDLDSTRQLSGAEDGRDEEGASFLADRLNQALADRDFSEEVARDLMQAGLRMTVSEYILIRAAVVLIAFLLGAVATRNPFAGIVAAVVGFFLPPLYVRRRRAKRLEAFNNQLEDVLTLLVGSLRAGYSFLHALNVVVEEIPAPASEEFRRVVREVGLGLSLTEALQNLVERLDSDDLDMVVTAVNIQQEVGGNLANILDVISETIRERVRIQGEIQVLTSRQKGTGYILALLPFILGAVLYILNPEYMSRLFKPGPTLVIPAVAVVLVFIGFLVIRKIVDIEV